jgi:anti-anti-sigma factor
LDATGLEMLLATRRQATLQGGELQLVDPAGAVIRVLEVTGFNRLFNHTPRRSAGRGQPDPMNNEVGGVQSEPR